MNSLHRQRTSKPGSSGAVVSDDNDIMDPLLGKFLNEQKYIEVPVVTAYAELSTKEYTDALRAVGVPFVVHGFPGFVKFAFPWLRPKSDTEKKGDVDATASAKIGATSNIKVATDKSSGGACGQKKSSIRGRTSAANYDKSRTASSKSCAVATADTNDDSSNIDDRRDVRRRQSRRLSSMASVDDAYKVPCDELFELDVEAVIDQIGDEIVPVITAAYEGTGPIKDSMTVEK
jgi:hypothetical protein